MGLTAPLRVPARRVFGQLDVPGMPERVVSDVAVRTPQGKVWLLGLQTFVDEAVPGTFMPLDTKVQAECRDLGIALADAVQAAIIYARGEATPGQIFPSEDVAGAFAALMGLVYRREIFIAGIQAPPGPEPLYVRFHPGALKWWQINPLDSEALPVPPAVDRYIQLRVFTPSEWARVEAGGGRLPLASEAAPSTSPMPNLGADEALAWMIAYAEEVFRKHGRPPRRYAAGDACHQQTGFPAREARKLEGRFPSHLKNPRKG